MIQVTTRSSLIFGNFSPSVLEQMITISTKEGERPGPLSVPSQAFTPQMKTKKMAKPRVFKQTESLEWNKDIAMNIIARRNP